MNDYGHCINEGGEGRDRSHAGKEVARLDEV